MVAEALRRPASSSEAKAEAVLHHLAVLSAATAVVVLRRLPT